MKSKVIAIRVSEEIYDYIKSKQIEDNDPFISTTFKNLFMLNENYLFEYSISSKDKLWLQSLIASLQFVKLAEAGLMELKGKGKDVMIGIVQSIRVKMDMVIDQFIGSREINLDKEQMDRIFDSVNLMICALQKSSETSINWNKLQRIIKQNYGFSFEE